MRLTGESFDKRASRFGGGNVQPVVATYVHTDGRALTLRGYRYYARVGGHRTLICFGGDLPDGRRVHIEHYYSHPGRWQMSVGGVSLVRSRMPRTLREAFELAMDDEAFNRRSVLTLAEVAQESGAHVAAGLAMRYPGVGV